MRAGSGGRGRAPPAPRGLRRGAPDRHRLRAQLGELKAVFARGLCFFVPGIAIGTLLPVIGRFELRLDEFAFGILYACSASAPWPAPCDADDQPPARRRSRQHLGNGRPRRATLIAALAMTPLVVGLVCTSTVPAGSP
jgi:hypothetical protein